MKFPALLVSVVAVCAAWFAIGYAVADRHLDAVIKYSVDQGWNNGVHWVVRKAYEKKLFLAPDKTAASFTGCVFLKLYKEAPLLNVDGATPITISYCDFWGGSGFLNNGMMRISAPTVSIGSGSSLTIGQDATLTVPTPEAKK